MDDYRTAKRQKRSVACDRCRSQKIKCSGGQPCLGCVKRADVCEYPFRDRNVTIPESHLEKLEDEVEALKAQLVETARQTSKPETHHNAQNDIVSAIHVDPLPNPLLDVHDGLFSCPDSSQPVYVGQASDTAFGDRLLQCINGRKNSIYSSNTMPNHITHPSFNRLMSTHFQLPPRTQATLLIRRAESFIGTNYFLHGRRSFFRKLDKAYNYDAPPDLLFVCQLFAVLALGELYNTCKTNLGDNHERIPGTSWYIQAVSLLQDLYETTSIEQVQILLLLSFFANALGRVKTAHVYCGIALRLAISLGLHRSQSGTNPMDSVQRETRRRTWWTLYLFDRMISSKLGYPLGIQEEDIDAELPSMDGLSVAECGEFNDPVHLVAHVKLARITGDILNDIYLPQPKRATFVQRVHRVLNNLRAWDDELPHMLRLQSDSSPRNLYTLHMQYHLCIMQTTRPILFLLFRNRVDEDTRAKHLPPQQFSPTTLALADQCVQAARTTNQLLTKLFVEGSLAVFGYFDAHYLFSSTLVLIMAAFMEPTKSISDVVQTAFDLLEAMTDNGNVAAKDYTLRLRNIRDTLYTASARMAGACDSGPSSTVPRTTDVHWCGNSAGAAPPEAAASTSPATSCPEHSHPEDVGDPFSNELIEMFLAEKVSQWDGQPASSEQEVPQFVYELGDENFVF